MLLNFTWKTQGQDKLQLKNIVRTSLRKTDGSPGILIAPHIIFPHYLNNYLHIIYFNYFHAFHRSQDVLLKGKINTILHKAILQQPHSELISSQYNEPQNKNCPINNKVPQSSHATPVITLDSLNITVISTIQIKENATISLTHTNVHRTWEQTSSLQSERTKFSGLFGQYSKSYNFSTSKHTLKCI